MTAPEISGIIPGTCKCYLIWKKGLCRCVFFSDFFSEGEVILNYPVGLNAITYILFFKFIYFIYFYFWLFWVSVAARGLFSSCSERGLPFVAVHGLLSAVASLVAEHGLYAHGLQ